MEGLTPEFIAAQVIQLGAVLIGIHKAVLRLEKRIVEIETRVDAMWQKYTGGRR